MKNRIIRNSKKNMKENKALNGIRINEIIRKITAIIKEMKPPIIKDESSFNLKGFV